ncbi:archaeoflavoprotein AfpA [Candidatus Bathyarchaeota archaeon]|nr:archaeoflavoprotein AfpA [Candidatus Bathyarchaeota archaeon]
MKVAWGITGSGDKVVETLETMKRLKEKYPELRIEVFLSKAGAIVAKYYRIEEKLKHSFDKVWTEKDANTPFLVARLQLKEFSFILIAPSTSNTVAKLAVGISDTLLTNAALQAVKGFVPVYIMPVDYHEGETTTTLPSGKTLRLRVRKEDAENVRKLEAMEGIHPFQRPEEIPDIFEKYMRKD